VTAPVSKLISSVTSPKPEEISISSSNNNSGPQVKKSATVTPLSVKSATVKAPSALPKKTAIPSKSQQTAAKALIGLEGFD
jgi:hypothetical protein